METPYAPVDVEIIFGIDGISGRYKYPNNARPEVLEFFYKSRIGHDILESGCYDKKEIRTDAELFLKQLIDVNPDLATLIPLAKSTEQLIDSVFGVVSGFNIDDIKYFLTVSDKEKQQVFLHGHARELRERTYFIDRAPTIGWLPSPKTATLIHQKLDEKYGVYEIPDVYNKDRCYSQFSNWPPYETILEFKKQVQAPNILPTPKPF